MYSNLHDLIATQADARSNAPALLAPGRKPITYQCLLGQIDRVGSQLNEMGIGHNKTWRRPSKSLTVFALF